MHFLNRHKKDVLPGRLTGKKREREREREKERQEARPTDRQTERQPNGMTAEPKQRPRARVDQYRLQL